MSDAGNWRSVRGGGETRDENEGCQGSWKCRRSKEGVKGKKELIGEGDK